MTTEEDFQRVLDENITDWQTRLILADWLEEHDDPRADGYRALGRLQKWPHDYTKVCVMLPWTWWIALSGKEPSDLPDNWFKKLKMTSPGGFATDRNYKTRREAEDAAAEAFVRLPPTLREKFLAQEEVG